MGFLDQIKKALDKKQAAQHPESKQQEQEQNKSRSQKGVPNGSNKPQKKVTGRGR